MFTKIKIKFFLILSIFFILTCDERQPEGGNTDSPSSLVTAFEVGNQLITIARFDTVTTHGFNIVTQDDKAAPVEGAVIQFEVLEGPGYLQTATCTSNTQGVASGEFNIFPETESSFNYFDTTKVNAWIEDNDIISISKIIPFTYQPEVKINEIIVTPFIPISILDESEKQVIDFNISPVDTGQVLITGVDIDLLVSRGPGIILNGRVSNDTTAAIGQFEIHPIDFPDFSFSDTTVVLISIDQQGFETIQDSIQFIYTDGVSSSEATNLEIVSISADNINDTEQSDIMVRLFSVPADDEELTVGIENKWLKFESLVPDADDGEGNNLTFGQMDPVYVETDEFGYASSTFLPLNQTGFANIKISEASEDGGAGGLETETYIEVVNSQSSLVNMVMIVPSENDLMVQGGGGEESITIDVEIRNGFGNLVDEDYMVIFSIPCPYPIDGPCPIGDGNFSNDITLNGQVLNGSEPVVAVSSINGRASASINSGNRPGSVRLNAVLCDLEDYNADQFCNDPLTETERVATTISTGPPVYGRVVAGWAEADSTGGGIYSLPITAAFWDQWTNPIADSTNVYWFINPEHIAYVDPSSEIGNCGSEEPGQACTTAYYTSGDIFSQGQICAQVYNNNNEPFIACSGGARCEDYNMSSCLSASDQGIGCAWISNDEDEQDEGECYFKYSEPYCNNFIDQDSCESIDNELESPFNCIWAPGALTAIPEWQAELNDGLGCHYRPIVEGLDQQQFYFDGDGDGIDDLFTGEWEAIGEISPDDPICNRNDLSAFDYQNYSQECESNPVCSWEFIASDANSGSGAVGSCIYNGGSGYYNPCVDCQIDLIPLSPNTIDYCASEDEPLDFLIRGHLGDAYGDDVHLGTLILGVYDASEFYFISSEDTTIDEDMGYEFDPPIAASATQITDSAGEVYWIVQFPNGNCFQTNPDDPDAFTCQSPYLRAFLLDPLNGESIDLNVNLFKYCQP